MRSARAGRDLAFPVAAAVVAGTALFTNFYRLSRPPVLSDEPEYAAMAWRYVHWGSLPAAARSSVASNFEHPPLAKLLFGLAQDVTGQPSITAARAVSATCTLIAAAVLGWWLARVAGRWTGLLGGGMLALLPMTVFPQVTGFGRTAMLDPVAEMFMVASVVAGWFWFHSSGRRSWLLAVSTGLAVGLSSASKENGFLGVVAPVALGLVWSRTSAPGLAARLAQVAVALVTSIVTFVCCYLPFGDPIGRIAYLFRFQTRHSASGHEIGLPGTVTDHPPWWANLYFAGLGLGGAVAALVVLTVAVAIALRHDRLVAWCGAAIVAPFVFHAFLADVVLPYYWVMWMPMVLALSALGMAQLGRVAWRTERNSRAALAALAAAVALVGAVVPIVAQTWTVARVQLVGPAAVHGVRARLGLQGFVLAAGIPLQEITPFVPPSRILLRLPNSLARVDTVLIGQPRCRTPVDPGIRAFTELNLEIRSLRLARADRLLRMYVAVGELHAPTPAEIRAQPPTRLTDHC